MTNQEKLFNIIKLGCTLLQNNDNPHPRSYDLDNCVIHISTTKDSYKLYIKYKSINLIEITYFFNNKKFRCWNTFGDELRFDNDIISMDFTQYILSYGRLNDFMLGILCGLFIMYDEIITGIGNQLL